MGRTDPGRFARAAIRMTLDSTSYSNPLPEWTESTAIDYSSREPVIESRIAAYLNGGAAPKPATPIAVPRKNSSTKIWSVPTVNDQIVLQACALALSDAVEDERVVDWDRVFSYRLNDQPDRLAFVENQLAAWSRFKDATDARLASKQALLQLDLQEAFRSIDQAKFLSFFGRHARSPDDVKLLGTLLGAMSTPAGGVPLVNESLFYLGNVYLAEVDAVVRKHAPEFIRFVDDYRIFDPSRERLKAVLEKITADLRPMGFRPNLDKVQLSDAESFLDAVAEKPDPDAADDDESESYISAKAFLDDVADPGWLAWRVKRAIVDGEPLTEGMGRYTLQTLRRMRLEDAVVRRRGKDASRLSEYEQKVSAHVEVDRVLDRIKKFAGEAEGEWRVVWALYVFRDALGVEAPAKELAAALSGRLGPVAQCWLAAVTRERLKPSPKIAALHDMSYVEAGKALYGG